MFMTKILQMIEKSFDNFKDWGCKITCVKFSCYCRKYNPVTRYVCFKFYV